MVGQGRAIFPTGDMVEGSFIRGKQNGACRKKLFNGDIEDY